MARYKQINNEVIELTAEEETALNARENSAPSLFEKAMEDLRFKRNAKLAETDWVVLPDSSVADKTAWQNYRTELRDLTNGLTTVEEVDAVIWPTKPGA
jgi:hypothetical protein